MALKNCVFVFFSLCLCIDNNNFVLGYEKPFILSEFEHTLETNGNFTFCCQGNKPLQWTVPEVEESKKSWTHFSTIEEKPSDPKFVYDLRLIITNMTYPFVGYYYCHHVGATVDSETESDKVYLFVDDDEHLSIFDEDEPTMETIIVIKGEQAVIPCKPSSPEVSVKLRTLTSTEDILEQEVTNYRYNERIGIITNDTYDDEKVLICEFSRRDSQSINYIRIVAERPVSHIAIPALIDKSDNHTLGNLLLLRCQVKSPISVDFKWKTPHGEVDEKRMTLSNIQMIDMENMLMQELTVHKTDPSDSGNYTCVVSNHQGHSSEAEISIKVYGLEENDIEVKEPNNTLHNQTYTAKDSFGHQYRLDVVASSVNNSVVLKSLNLELTEQNIVNCYKKQSSGEKISANEAEVDKPFFNALEDLMDSNNKVDIEIFKYVIKQKDSIINELRDKVQLLTNQLKILNDKNIGQN